MCTDPIPEEVEAKFSAPSRDVLDAIAPLDRIENYIAVPKDTQPQADTYYDTPSLTLRKNDCAYRVRRRGGRCFVALKCIRAVHAAVHVRGEEECEVSAAQVTETPLAGAPGEHVRRMTGDARLLPLLELTTIRRALHLQRESNVAFELCLDETEAAGARGCQTFYEVEVECVDDSTSALEGVATWLQASYPLSPTPLSKLERGIELVGALFEPEE